MNDITPFVICAIVIILMSLLIMNGLIHDSGWSQFKDKYRYTDKVPVKMRRSQNVLLNQTCFRGIFSLGISSTGIFIGMRAVIYIPFSDLKWTNRRKHLCYRILEVNDSNLQIGLEKRWIEKINIPNQSSEPT